MIRRLTSLLSSAALGLSVLAAATVAAPASATTAPTCSLAGASPRPGATVSGTITLQSVEVWEGTEASEFFLDGKSIGFSSRSGQWLRTYARPGTVAGGLDTTGRANGTHTLACRNVGTYGNGPMSPAQTVTFSNSIRSTMTWPTDGAVVDGTISSPGVTLKVSNSVTGTAQPTRATFYVDGKAVGTAPCSNGVCQTTWDAATSTSGVRFPDAPEKPRGGLRILHAEVTAGNGKVGRTSPTKVFVNRSDTASRPLLSSYEANGLGRVARDGGYSAQIPGANRTLFVMNDAKWTFQTGVQRGQGPGWGLGPYLATAPIRAGQPTTITETGRPGAHGATAPARARIEVTKGLTDPNGNSCDQRLTWATGVTQSPTSSTKMLITYTGMCNEPATTGGENVLRRQVEGVAEYDTATDTASMYNILVAPAGRELPEKARLSSPVREGSYLYFYHGNDAGSYAVRVAATSWKTASAYRWWSNGSFSATDAAKATPIGSGTSTQVSVARYPGITGSPYLKITQPTWQTVTIEKSSTPYGPWSTTSVKDLKVCPECQDAGGFVYTAYGHPELSPAGQVLLTFTDTAEYTIHSKLLTVR